MCDDPISYFEIPDLPGVKMFRCLKRRATLSRQSCTGMWTLANKPRAPEHLDACRNCEVGASHGGVKQPSVVPYRKAMLCARCRRLGARMVKGHLCISCANREYEYVKGRNARGAKPVLHPPLYALSLIYRSGREVGRIALERVTGKEELMIAALRDDPMRVSFTFKPSGGKTFPLGCS